MEAVVIQENQRLDEIVFAHYGNLDHFDDVVEKNEHLSSKLFLSLGDKVELPEYETKAVNTIKAKTLWD